MKDYLVSIERNSQMIQIGKLRGESHLDVQFSYSEKYLSDPTAAPISLSLPLQEEAFSTERTRNYFEGLLPEGFTRRSVAQWLHLDENDYLSILYGLGRECLGAVQITAEEETPAPTYEEITNEQVRQLAAEGSTKSTELVMKSHLSLTGASGKAGLYFDSANNRWYLPKGTAPSTHIVKQSHVRLEEIVTNEQLCLLTAARYGIEVPNSFIINTGSGGEDEVLFATQRYDRIFSDDGCFVSGLPCPLRLHQEDFAQALGIPSSQKYETSDSHYLADMFALLRQYAKDPISDQLKLWDLIIFNWLIGNTDAHIKNYSLLYDPTLRTVRLAPAYDIVSTTVYESSTRDLSIRIGDALTIDDVTADSFRKAAKEIGLGSKLAMRHVAEMSERFIPALKASAEELTNTGFPKAMKIAEKILKSSSNFSTMREEYDFRNAVNNPYI